MSIDAEVSDVFSKTYPNPVVGNELNIELKDCVGFDYVIFNIAGTQLQSGKSIGSKTAIEVGDLSKGTYLLRITSEGQTLVNKFIKK